jgi:D-alanine-D-alanine ligase
MRTIAVAGGGNSSEYEISVKSARAVVEALQKQYNTYLIFIRGLDWYWEDPNGRAIPLNKDSFSLKLDDRTVRFDAVFIAIHGAPGENGQLQGYFDMLNIPYTSPDAATSALTFNKHYCNRFVNSYGIKTAQSLSFTVTDEVDPKDVVETLGLPVFVKPAESGSSVGISKVKEPEELLAAVETAFRESDRILIEEFIDGRELACGMINKGKQLIVFPLTEIISKKDFFDYEAKYTEGMADEITPADISEEIEQDIKALSSFLFRELDCKGFVRFDYILSGNELYFLEVNTIPGISEASIIPKMADAYGMSFKALLNIAIDNLFDK